MTFTTGCYVQSFWFAGLAMAVPLLMLLVVRPAEIDRAKAALPPA